MAEKEPEKSHQEIIIIKKVKKGHGGHHGGAWKVAYADFVTAMMAFFLMMWLISMTTEQQKVGLGDYFQNYSPFQNTGLSQYKDKSIDPNLVEVEASAKEKGKAKETEIMEAAFQKIKDDINEKFKSLQDQIIMDFTSEGMRIQIIDKEGNSMFNSGSPDVNPWSKEVLQMIANNIKDLPNRVAIEGHTDSVPFKASGLSNWELSTARASAARKEFEKDGIEGSRFAKIVGFADTQPFVKYDTKDAMNRRINIILLKDSMMQNSAALQKGTPGTFGTPAGPAASGGHH